MELCGQVAKWGISKVSKQNFRMKEENTQKNSQTANFETFKEVASVLNHLRLKPNLRLLL
jgi:hypothetical protein